MAMAMATSPLISTHLLVMELVLELEWEREHARAREASAGACLCSRTRTWSPTWQPCAPRWEAGRKLRGSTSEAETQCCTARRTAEGGLGCFAALAKTGWEWGRVASLAMDGRLNHSAQINDVT